MAKAKLTHVKVPLDRYLRLKDMASVASYTGHATTNGKGCGRTVVEGYRCIYCGADTSDPDFDSADCKFPLSKVKADAENGKF